jgi:hypothetical protein
MSAYWKPVNAGGLADGAVLGAAETATADDVGSADGLAVAKYDADGLTVRDVDGKLESAGAAQPTSRLIIDKATPRLLVIAGMLGVATTVPLRQSLSTTWSTA